MIGGVFQSYKQNKMIDLSWRPNEEHLPWLVLVSGFVIFVTNVDLLSTGDTIYYANIIDTMSFDRLTAHQGYYVLGLIVSALMNIFVDVPTDQALAYMSVIFGSAALCVAYVLAKHYLESSDYALLTVLVLLISHRFFENSIWAEIYVVQAFFLWTAMLLFERRWFYSSGLALVFAFWITPLTLPFCLWFAVSAYLRRTGWLSLLKTAIPGLVLYGLFLGFFYEELLWGNRGLLLQDQAREVLLGAGLKNFVAYQFKHYTILNLLLIPAVFLIRKYSYLAWTSIAICLPNIYVISQLRGEDNVFILPLDFIFAIWMVIGIRYLVMRRLGTVAFAMIVFHGAVFVWAERLFLRETNAEYPTEIREIGETIRSQENSMIFFDWSARMAFIYFNRNEPSWPLEDGYWYDKSFDLGRIRREGVEPNDFANHGPIYVLETWDFSPYASLFLSDSAIEERRARVSRKAQLERFLDVQCTPHSEGIYVLHRCEKAKD